MGSTWTSYPHLYPTRHRQALPRRSLLTDSQTSENCTKQCIEHRSSFAIGNNYQTFFLLRHVTIDTILLSRLELFSRRLMQMSSVVAND